MKTIPLGKIANVATGGTPVRDTPEYWGGSIPWVGTGEIDFNIIQSHTDHLTQKGLDASAAKLLPKGTLLMAMYGQGATRGKVGILGFDAATNQACAAITPKNGTVESEFLFHVLEASYTRIRRLSNIGGQDNLNTTLIREIPIPVLSKPERETVVAAAREWADGIQKTETLLSVLERRKQGLMQQLLTGRRRLKGFKGKWKLLRADKLFTEISVRKQTADEALLSVTQDRGVIPRDMLVGRVTMPAGAVDAFKLVERDNFVISLRSFQGGLEHSAYRGLVSPAYTVLQASEDIHPAFFRHYFKSTDFVKRLSVAVVGIRDGKQISYTDFRSIKLPLPPMAEQQSLTELLDLAEQDIALCRERLEELQRQKRALMQKLLSGEWRLPEAPTQNKPASKKGLQPPNNVRK